MAHDMVTIALVLHGCLYADSVWIEVAEYEIFVGEEGATSLRCACLPNSPNVYLFCGRMRLWIVSLTKRNPGKDDHS